jgi:hypothetical protein
MTVLVTQEELDRAARGTTAAAAPLPFTVKQEQATSAPACARDLLQEAQVLTQYNEEVLQRFLDTRILLDMWPRIYCTLEEYQQLLVTINWEDHARFVEQDYSESLARCVTKMINQNHIDRACLMRAREDRDAYLRRDDAIRDIIRTACKVPLVDDSEPEKPKTTYSCNGAKVSSGMTAWLAETRDNLVDKRLVCFLAGNMPVKSGDKVGRHTVYPIEGQVAGIAIPTDPKKQLTTSGSTIGNLLRIGLQSMQYLLNLLQNSLQLLVKLAACGLEWALGKLWVVKTALVMVLLTLMSHGVLTPESVLEFIQTNGLGPVTSLLQIMQKFCSVGFSSAALGAYLVVTLKAMEVVTDRQRAMIGSLMVKVFIPLFTVVCGLQYVNFEALGMSLPNVDSFNSFWSTVASTPGVGGGAAAVGDIPLTGFTEPAAVAAVQNATQTLQQAAQQVDISPIPAEVLQEGNTLFAEFVRNYGNDAAAGGFTPDDALAAVPVTLEAAEQGDEMFEEATTFLSWAVIGAALTAIRAGMATVKHM